MSLFKEKLELEIEEAEFLANQALNRFPPVLKYSLMVCVLATVPAYFITKKISHAYWQKKYQNSIVQAKPSFENPLPPKVSPFTLISSQGSYSAVTQISNENLDLSLPETPYKIDFLNNQNEIVYTSEGKLFLLPNQKKYAVVGRFQSPDIIASANFNFLKTLTWQKRLSISKVNLSATPAVFSNQTDPLAFVVEGSVQNQSPYSLKQIHLTFLVKDANGQLITASQRDEFTVEPGKTRSFKQLWPGLFLTNVSKVEVIAETNPLDRGNLNLQEQNNTDASDLTRPPYSPY